MKIYGYDYDAYYKDENWEAPLLTLRQTTLELSTEELEKIIEFLNHSLFLMKKYGNDFGHEHFSDFLKNKKYEDTDIIVIKEK